MLGEIISVKEYAARKGTTEQAVYKQIRAGKLQTFEQTAPAAVALAELSIKALTAQLEAKDRQIEELTHLLDNSQKLQAHSQSLLEPPQPDPG